MSADSFRILVVDDEVGMREGCRRALVPHGYQVHTAEHGAAGLRMLREELFDLVLLDAMMPGMSGLELLQHIHDHDPDITCVMITGYATVDLTTQAMKAGAHDFLPKPFLADDLLAVVQRGLDERQRRLALRQRRVEEEESQEVERARRETAKLDAIESRFMLVLVHELRNPAGVLKSYLQLVRSGYVDDDEMEGYLEKMDLRAGQLIDMLDDLLELAHLKQQSALAQLEPVALAPLMDELVRSFDPAAKLKGLELQLEAPAGPTLLAQPAHLRSLWSHLIDNAIRYTPRGGGPVRVGLSVAGDRVAVTVADSGIGIATEELPRIFQEFYRSEAAKAEMELGTGLGLSIVDQVVKLNHGAIEVDSAPGQGSTFTVSLPLAEAGDAGRSLPG